MLVEGPINGKNIVGSIEHTVSVEARYLEDQYKYLLKISGKLEHFAKLNTKMSTFFNDFNHALENECFDSLTLCASK